ncbi:MAG: glycerol-3-phosphate 1-O-acyltransferase PlsY [Verrucomicrobia bacterium]|nr:glycerol-3-phosphate 1-O-acyltransferase PlsY [Verrucomicrobiota bacterium]
MMLSLLIAAAAGYVLGALPFGYLVARARGVNIFEVGSKNPGATNVRRVLGHGAGNVVLLLDVAKGALAAGWPLLAAKLGGPGCDCGADQVQAMGIAGLIASILGHSFSCFTGFRGGKSVATAAGAFALLFPAGMGVALVVFLATLGLSRYVSLSSMLGAVSLVVATLVLRQSIPVIVVGAAAAAFVLFRHRSNISRLLAGTETKVGRKPAPPAGT